MPGDDAPLSLLELLSEAAFDTLGDSALEEPLLPWFGIFDPLVGALETTCGELLDSPASESDDPFPANAEPEAPKCEVLVRKPFALLISPEPPEGRWLGEEPAPVGTA